MASSQRPGERVVHQDYLARIRYSNTLPPPPNPPKLLDIPGTGLAGGQYTTAGYASKLWRDQPLNIEADAELGMPIDLVGIPGIFDGDESAIMARPSKQPLHETDKLLLRPLGALGKGGTGGAVSFLRRTEYTSSQGPQHFSGTSSKDLLRLRNDNKRRRLSQGSLNKEDPINIIKNIVKGFDITNPRDAYKGDDSSTNTKGAPITEAEARAWSNLKHPSKPDLELLDSYPVLPDLEALTSMGSYVVMKFQTNPIPSTSGYDSRLDAAIFRPRDNDAARANYEQKKAEWMPESGKPEPIVDGDYDFFLPTDTTPIHSIKRKLDVNDPENDDEGLYTDDGAGDSRAFKYARLRTYETYNQHGDPNHFYDDSVALVLHDPELEVGKQRLQKGAYFYPIYSRTALRPKRNVGPMKVEPQLDEERIDEINLRVCEMDEDSRAGVERQLVEVDPSISAAA